MIRNKETGLIENLEYLRKENGKIDWKKMIPEKFLYLNPAQKTQLEKKYSKKYDEIKVSEAEDKELVILLAGIRFVLDLYGYLYVKTNIITANPDYAVAHTEIQFLPNSDEPISQVYSDNACGTRENTNGFGQKYLVEMAGNRSLARCVRGYLGIGIVSREELNLDGSTEETSSTSNGSQKKPLDILKELSISKGVGFSYIKKRCMESPKKYEGAENWKSFDEIPSKYYLLLVESLKKVKDKDS